MALTVTVETGSGDDAAANSYLSRAEADAYHEAVIDSLAWTDAADGDKDKALVAATRVLDTQFDWRGCRAVTGQPLAWPRSGVVADGVKIDDDDIPKQIESATAEIARELLDSGAFQTRPAGSGGADQIQGINLGKGALKIDYQEQADSAARSNADKTVVSPYVRQLLRELGAFLHASSRIRRVRR